MQVFAAGIAGCDLTLPTTLMPACVCREDRGAIPALLEQLVERDFFSYFPVNLITPCMYFPSEDEGCWNESCEIQAVRDRDVPAALLQRDRDEYGFTCVCARCAAVSLPPGRR